MKTKLSVFFLLLAFWLVACGGNAETPSLAGTSWKLVKIDDQEVVPDTAPTLTFDNEGRAGGNASCNSFGGSYEIKDGNLTFGPLMSTMMACMEPAGTMEQESAYLAALGNVASYQISGARLLLSDVGGATLLVFESQDQSVK